MSESGVYYTAAQLSAMGDALAQAQTALNSGDAQAAQEAISAVGQYYAVQIVSPVTGQTMRGYATLAEQTATNTGIGIVPNDEVKAALLQQGISYTTMFQATLALQLAEADYNVVSTNGGQVPTLSEVAAYHAAVFANNNIPLTAWGGTAYTALDQDFTLGLATSAESSSITTDQFSGLSASDVSSAIMNLLGAGEAAAPSLPWGSLGDIFSLIGLDILAASKFGSAYPAVFPNFTQNEDGTYQVADAQNGVYQNISAGEIVNYSIQDNNQNTGLPSNFTITSEDGFSQAYSFLDAPPINLVDNGLTVAVDPSNFLSIGGQSVTLFLSGQDFVTLEDLDGPAGPSGVNTTFFQGNGNVITDNDLVSTVTVSGYLNDIVAGAGSTTVDLNGYTSPANFVIGGPGSLAINSTSVATIAIGGTGTLNCQMDAPSCTLIGGSGVIDAQITSDGVSIFTGSGVSTINLQGDGGQVVTGSGTSAITYSGDGGMFYQGDPTGIATFNLTGIGISVNGGNNVTVTGQGDEILPWSPVPSWVEAPISGYTQSDPTFAAAIASSTAPLNLDGSVTAFDDGPPSGSRTITLNADESSVSTGDQPSSITVNGSNNTLEGGAGYDTIDIASGSSNWIIASGGNNTYIDPTGSSELDYTGSPSPAYVNLATGIASNGFGGTDTLSGITWVDAGGGSTLIAGNVNARLEIDGDGGSLYGGTGSDSLTGNGNGITFYAGAGSHQISANGTDDLYVLTPSQYGNGTVEINQSAPGVAGTMQFTSGIGPSNLWLSQDSSGNLVATVLGTNSSVTVDGWFDDGSSSQLSQILTDTTSLDNAQINGLESAMAAYQNSNPGFDPTSATAMPTDPTLDSALATFWQNQ